jgi:hypothetical protein
MPSSPYTIRRHNLRQLATELEAKKRLTDPDNLQLDILYTDEASKLSTDEAELLREALRRRQELRERCLHELWERFGIEVTDDGVKLGSRIKEDS